VRDYGGIREDNPIDRKRRYANSAPRPGDLREERAAKRRSRAAGKKEIRADVVDLEAAEDEEPLSCGSNCCCDDLWPTPEEWAQIDTEVAVECLLDFFERLFALHEKRP
jgi:hypothetical protein